MEENQNETTEEQGSTAFKLVKFVGGIIVASIATKLLDRGLDSWAARGNKTTETE